MGLAAFWAKKLLYILVVVVIGVALDVMYLYLARTKGGMGFKFSIRPDVGD